VTQRLGSLEVGERRDYVGQGIAWSRRGSGGWDVKQQVDLSMVWLTTMHLAVHSVKPEGIKKLVEVRGYTSQGQPAV